MTHAAMRQCGRCKDEFGQLDARLLGIKNVRQTVSDGWGGDRGGNPPAEGGIVVANGVAGNRGKIERSSPTTSHDWPKSDAPTR